MTSRRTCLGWLATSGAGSAWAARSARLRMVAAEFPPYTSAHLPGGGISAAITRDALAGIGHGMELAIRPWARAVAEFLQGQHDGLINAWYTDERNRTMLFTRDLGIRNRLGFMARAGGTWNVGDLSSLAGRRIGVGNGYANPARFERAREQWKIQIDVGVNDLGNLRKLQAGRVDLIIIDRGVGQFLLRTQMAQVQEQLVWLDPALSEEPVHTVFARNRPDMAPVAAAFGQQLAKMEASGRIAELVKLGGDWL